MDNLFKIDCIYILRPDTIIIITLYIYYIYICIYIYIYIYYIYIYIYIKTLAMVGFLASLLYRTVS